MNDSFDFDEPDFVTVGTLGPRGQRVFYLQARAGAQLVSLKLEKQQVSALADYLDRALDELPDSPLGALPDDLDLREPVIEAWAIGSLGIAYAQELDRLVVVAEELLEAEDDEPAQARFSLRREQVAGLIERARHVVAAGRPPCPYCGRPLDPRNDDWCACRN